MNAQVPAYLQNKTRVDLNAIAAAGMGGTLPNHISIAGNGFTLIDEAGRKMPLGAVMDAVVVDIAEVMAKRYYENEWTSGSDEPPTCWSMNGIGPSRESVAPQARTCGECQWNVRGSDTSKLSGKAIKACRDEKPLAILLPQYPQMLFQLILPPGSFKNWTAFTKPFEKSGLDVSDVLIRFGFEPQKNGVMTFALNGYIPENLIPVFNQARAAKATDVLVGRTDVAIALPAPIKPIAVPAPLNSPAAQENVVEVHQAPFGVPTAAATTVPQAGAPITAQPEQPRRRRRTNAEIAADNAAKAGATQQGTAPAATAQAPFPTNQPAGFGSAPAAPAQPEGFGGAPAATTQPGTFGIQNGQDPNVDPQLAAMLATLKTPG